MSQHFNLTRFGRLLRKHLTEHLTSYLMRVAVLLGGMMLVMGYVTYLQRAPLNQGGQAAMFTLFLLAAGSFFASTAFGQYGVGQPAALALTLPASQLEKYLVAWLFSLPLFLLVLVPTFYVADWLVLHVVSPQPRPLVNVFSAGLFSTFRLYLVLHGVALWGSIFFQKLQSVRTAAAGFGLAGLLSLANYRMLKGLFGPDVQLTFPFGAVHFGITDLDLPAAQTRWLFLLPLALAALLWAAAYARLTEKQL